MDDIVIRPVSTKRDIRTFIQFPWKIYADYPAWVPPLLSDRRKIMDKQKNPFYKHADAEFFIAERDGIIVGRIAAIINYNHNKIHNENVGFWGFFESINDQAVATALFETAKNYVKERGATAFRGPLNPSVNDDLGLLIEGFDLSPAVMMPYNPPYYIPLVESYGFHKAKDLYAFSLNQDEVYSEKLERVYQIVKEKGRISFRSIDMKHFDEEVERFKRIYNKAWEKNWGAVPMTDEEMDALAADLKLIVEPELVIFAEKEGETIGVGLTVPDINIALKYNKHGYLLTGIYHLITKKKKINQARILVLGVLPEYLKTGAAAALFYETAIRSKKLGIYYGEASWILEDNEPMVRAAEALNAKISKRYRIYEMSLM
ncbi:MAG TPA: hypothetical protein PK595_02740 [Bacteroidota bacterium]|nr:hypothetical protein [Bacteroidota bacterium]